MEQRAAPGPFGALKPGHAYRDAHHVFQAWVVPRWLEGRDFFRRVGQFFFGGGSRNIRFGKNWLFIGLILFSLYHLFRFFFGFSGFIAEFVHTFWNS